MLDSFTHPIEGATPPPGSTEALITEHMPLVGFAVSEIGMRLPAHVDREDLRSAGLVGLVQAAQEILQMVIIIQAEEAAVQVELMVVTEVLHMDIQVQFLHHQ